MLEAEKLDPVSPIISYVATAAYLANDRIDEAVSRGSADAPARSKLLLSGFGSCRRLSREGEFRRKRSRFTPKPRRQRISRVAALPSPTRAWAGKRRREIFLLSLCKQGRSDTSRRL